MRWKHGVTTVGAAGILWACGTNGADTITVEDLAREVRTLSSDEFEGRGPSSPGEEKTVAYLEQRFREIGLGPGNGDSYFQDVPLVASTVQGAPQMTIRGVRGTRVYDYRDDHVVWTKRVVEESGLNNSDLVFVGYGIVAPEYDWNDYEGLDVSGKTVVILVNDPGFATRDEAVFNGTTMTYYGRWTYKFEEAARQGAAGALIVHDTEPAAYPWDVVRNSWTGPQFTLAAADDNMGRIPVEGWITLDVVQGIFADGGHDFGQLSAAAARPGFRAVALGARVSVSFRNSLERSNSRNVVGVLPGGARADEYVIYMAHWDHFGRDSSVEGDQIYNGALDNATGVAGLLELAEAFAAQSGSLDRSVMFLAVTAEEFGLLGSAHYAAEPLVPTAKTVGAINIDGLNINGPMRDITVVGLGNSELDDYLAEAAEAAGRVLRPDPEPEKGFYYRSDHFSLAKVGIPAIYTDAGIDNIEHGEAWAIERRDEYTANNYHKPSDEMTESWDLTGAVDDLKLLFEVGHALAASDAFPNWREGTEFKAIRDRDLCGGSAGCNQGG